MPNGMQSLRRGAPSVELHALGDNVWTCVFDQSVNVVGRDHVVQHGKTEALLRLEIPNAGNGDSRIQTLVKNFL